MIDLTRSSIVHYKFDGAPLCLQRGVNLNLTIHPWEITCFRCKRKEKELRSKEGR